jgi:hypothetical protein
MHSKKQKHAQHLGDQDLEAIARDIKSFAKRHAPNFDESRWNDYMHKKRKAEENGNN